MELIQKISEKYNVEALDEIPGVWFYEISTPILKIRHYLFYDITRSKIFCLSQKNNFFIEDLSVYKKILDNLSLEQIGSDFYLVDISDRNGKFDKLAVSFGEYHSVFKTDIPSLYKDTYVVFPCHHSEFLDSDTAEELTFCKNKVVKTLIWDREISPRVYLKFENNSNGVKTIGDDFLIGDLDYTLDLIDQLLNDNGILSIKNYKGERIDLKFHERICTLKGPFELKLADSEEIIVNVKSFLLN